MTTETPAPVESRPVEISAGLVQFAGDLVVPQGAAGVVAFAHGSGSGRYSPRNWYVAAALQRAGFATLLVGLLTLDESQEEDRISDIDLLASRLESCAAWLDRRGGELKRLLAGAAGCRHEGRSRPDARGEQAQRP
jgi:hypothetical protein